RFFPFLLRFRQGFAQLAPFGFGEKSLAALLCEFLDVPAGLGPVGAHTPLFRTVHHVRQQSYRPIPPQARASELERTSRDIRPGDVPDLLRTESWLEKILEKSLVVVHARRLLL